MAWTLIKYSDGAASSKSISSISYRIYTNNSEEMDSYGLHSALPAPQSNDNSEHNISPYNSDYYQEGHEPNGLKSNTSFE